MGMEIHRDRKDGKLWLSQHSYVVNILKKYGMNNVKSIKSLWLSIVIFLQFYVLSDEEEKGYMSRVLYSSRKFQDDYNEKWSTFHMQLVLSVNTWKNQVKSMEMGASNTKAQVSPTVVAVIWSMVMIHEIWTSASVY